MNHLTLINTDSGLYADSRDVAEAIERPHCDLLRTIRGYCEILNESKIALVDFFVPAEYEDAKGEKRPCYLITRKGCDMIANKLTGKKGVLFTAAYVTAFEKMHEQLTAGTIQHYPAKSTSAGEVSSLIKNVRITMERQESAPRKIAKQTELLLRHFGIPVIEDFVEPAPWVQLERAE
ncbi:MAG: Rha family transcriptional regulator [Oscillospiraceae bacterium]|nr:Rha family transcriptional regulator [Oscillospiraceae bacterium]